MHCQLCLAGADVEFDLAAGGVAALLCAETLSAIDVARLSVTRALMLGAGDVLVMDNYRCGWQGILFFC